MCIQTIVYINEYSLQCMLWLGNPTAKRSRRQGGADNSKPVPPTGQMGAVCNDKSPA